MFNQKSNRDSSLCREKLSHKSDLEITKKQKQESNRNSSLYKKARPYRQGLNQENISILPAEANVQAASAGFTAGPECDLFF